jgi:hypothetical protein
MSREDCERAKGEPVYEDDQATDAPPPSYGRTSSPAPKPKTK